VNCLVRGFDWSVATTFRRKGTLSLGAIVGKPNGRLLLDKQEEKPSYGADGLAIRY
jgi:hypothetical protein